MSDRSDDGDMHRYVGWMVPADVSVLNFLYAARDGRGDPSVQTPKTIAINTGYGRKHASARCQVLADHGLVEKIDHGEYQLTELGVALLEQEIAPEELNDSA